MALWITFLHLFIYRTNSPKQLLCVDGILFPKPRSKLRQNWACHLNSEGELIHNYNIAPTQQAYVISNRAPGALQLFQWGLIPSWSKDPKMGGKLINARAETVMDKPSFRTSIRQRRCLVLADSFYEWKKEGKEKTPFRIFPRNGELLVMGGIWDTWKGRTKLSTVFRSLPPDRIRK